MYFLLIYEDANLWFFVTRQTAYFSLPAICEFLSLDTQFIIQRFRTLQWKRLDNIPGSRAIPLNPEYMLDFYALQQLADRLAPGHGVVLRKLIYKLETGKFTVPDLQLFFNVRENRDTGGVLIVLDENEGTFRLDEIILLAQNAIRKRQTGQTVRAAAESTTGDW